MAIELISKIKPKNDQNFALVDANDVQINDKDGRLGEFIDIITGETESDEYILREVSPTKLVTGVLLTMDMQHNLEDTIRWNKYKSGSMSHQYALYDVTPGVTYYITGDIPSNQQYKVCGFYAADGSVISIEPRTEGKTVYQDYPVTAPENAATMMIIRYSGNISAIASKIKISMTGIEAIDSVARSLIDIDSKLTEVDKTVSDMYQVTKGKTLSPTSSGSGIMNAGTGSIYGADSAEYQHSVYAVEGMSRYFVTGMSAKSPFDYPCVFFMDENGLNVGSAGTDAFKAYEDLLVLAPADAVTMVVNNQTTSALVTSASEALVATGSANQISTANSYNLDMADELIRLEKRNPFQFAEFDKGYVTFIFDDLCSDLDSVASIFEEYGYPLVVAAIPENLGNVCTFLTATRGSFSPNMVMTDVLDAIVANGGEIMTHNTGVITADSQYDYNVMYQYFCASKETLQSRGYYPRGLIRAGGTGAIQRSDETQRWLVGNYEYSNFGTLPQHAWDRTTIQQSQSDLKAAILNAKTNRTWLKFMCHSYTFGGGTTFTGEADLRELLTYIQSQSIPVVTCGYIFDHFGSSQFAEKIKALENA